MKKLYFPLFSWKYKINIFAPAAFMIMFFSEGAGAFICILFAALLHEAGHLFFIRLSRQSVTGVTVEPFGAVIGYTSSKLDIRSEILIASGGMIANGIGFVSGTIVFLYTFSEYALLFVFANIFFALTNVFPLYGNDGSRILEILTDELPNRDNILKTSSAISFLLLFSLAALILYISDFNNGLCIILLIASIPKGARS